MSRQTFLTLAGAIALLVGAIATLTPAFLLTVMKGAEISPSALVMARTAGVLLLFAGGLNLLVRNDPPSATLRNVLIADIALQLMLLPIDPLAWATGAFTTLGSFLPTVLLHSLLCLGCLYYLRQMHPTR